MPAFAQFGTPAFVPRIANHDSSSETTLDRLVVVAAHSQRVPIALVSLGEADRQVLLAGTGFGETVAAFGEAPHLHSLCQLVVRFGKTLAINDVRLDSLSCDNRTIRESGITSFLGVPVFARNGRIVGCFCVADVVPRPWSADDRKIVESLALAVQSELNDQRAYLKLSEVIGSYREMLDTTTELVCAADGAGIITYVNRAWSEAFGMAAEDAIGVPAVSLVCEEHRARFVDVARQLHAGEAIEDFEVVAIGRNSRRVVCRGNATALGVRIADGAFRCVSTHAVYRDVTEERRAQAAHARLAATLEATSDFVGIARADGHIDYINTAGRRLLGIGEDVDVGLMSAHDFHPPETLRLLAEEGFPATIQSGSWKGEGALQTKGGGLIPVSIVMTAHPSLSPGEPSYFSAIMRDRRPELTAAAAMRNSESQLAMVYNNVSDLLSLMRVEYDPQGRVVEFRCESVNNAVTLTTGKARSEYTGQTLGNIVTTEHYAVLREKFELAATTGIAQCFEYESRGVHGTFVLETTLTVVKDGDGGTTHVLAASRDVTARRLANAALRRSETAFRTMLQTLRSVAVTLDSAGCITFANEALLSLTGWRAEHVLGQDWFSRFLPNAAEVRSAFNHMISGGEFMPHYDNEIITRSGRIRLIEWDNTLLFDDDGVVIGTASIGQDVTDQRLLEARLAELSERDELTGLLNRRGFVERVEDALKNLRASGSGGALLCLDLDKFKPINDIHGHAAGDDALRATSTLLHGVCSAQAFAGRIGGDEFAIFMVTHAAGDASALRDRLLHDLARHNLEADELGRPYSIGFSVGTAEVTAECTYESLVARADAAMYAIKRQRKH